MANPARFHLTAKRTGLFSGYNSSQFLLTAELQGEIDALLSNSEMLQDTPFSAIDLNLQFADYLGKPVIHYIDEKGLVLYAEAAVDWREHVKDSRLDLKKFFLSSIAECLLWIWCESRLPKDRLVAALSKQNIRPSEVIGSGEKLREHLVECFNELEIGMKLSDGEFGNEKEIQKCQELAMELEKFGPVGTLAGGGFYCIFVECNEPMQLHRELAPLLHDRKLRSGSYAEAKYLVNGYYKRDRSELA